MKNLNNCKLNKKINNNYKKFNINNFQMNLIYRSKDFNLIILLISYLTIPIIF